MLSQMARFHSFLWLNNGVHVWPYCIQHIPLPTPNAVPRSLQIWSTLLENSTSFSTSACPSQLVFSILYLLWIPREMVISPGLLTLLSGISWFIVREESLGMICLLAFSANSTFISTDSMATVFLLLLSFSLALLIYLKSLLSFPLV